MLKTKSPTFLLLIIMTISLVNPSTAGINMRKENNIENNFTNTSPTAIVEPVDTIVDSSLSHDSISPKVAEQKSKITDKAVMGNTVDTTIFNSKNDIDRSIGVNQVVNSSLRNYVESYPAFAWYDAMTSGYGLSLSGDDVSAALNLGFPFTFYDQVFSTVYISSNGWLSFTNTNPTAFSNPSFPDANSPYVIAPFWNDLVANFDVAVWQTTSFVVIEFYNYNYLSGDLAGTFEVVLFNDGTILFQYLSITNDFGSTIGLNYGLDINYYNQYQYPLTNTSNFAILYEQTVQDHDLQVRIDAPETAQLGQTLMVNATVTNIGRLNETSVYLYLYLNGVMVSSLPVSSLTTRQSLSISYSWIASTYGNNNFTAYAPAVFNESEVSNNIKTQFVNIIELLQIQPGNWFKYDWNGNYTEETRFTSWKIPNEILLGETILTDTIINQIVDVGTFEIDVRSGLIVNSTSWNPGTYLIYMFNLPLSVGSTFNFNDGTAGISSTTTFNYYGENRAAWTGFVSGWNMSLIIDQTTGLLLGLEDPSIGYTLSLIGTNIISVQHDLDVNLYIPNPISQTAVNSLNATVRNNGINTEYNLVVDLIIDGAVVSSYSYSTLFPGNSISFVYNWNSPASGNYNVTAYVYPVPGENYLDNNRQTEFVSVSGSIGNYYETYPAFTWYDAMSYGVNLNLNGDDVYTNTSMSFPFQFYDQVFYSVYISSNGYLSFVNPAPMEFSNPQFPDANNQYVIAPFWGDLAASGNVYVWNTFNFTVIEFNNYNYLGGNIAGTFEVVLFRDGTILFQYMNINSDMGNTIGLNQGYNLTLFNSYTQGLAGVSNFAIAYSTTRPAHELVAGLSIPEPVFKDTTVVIEATVINIGDNTEAYFDIELLLNQVSVMRLTVGQFLTDETFTMSYTWTPSEYGNYNFTTVVHSVPGEASYRNNVVTKFVLIREPLRVQPGDWFEYDWINPLQTSVYVEFTNWVVMNQVIAATSTYKNTTTGAIIDSDYLEIDVRTGIVLVSSFWMDSSYLYLINLGFTVGSVIPWIDVPLRITNTENYNYNGIQRMAYRGNIDMFNATLFIDQQTGLLLNYVANGITITLADTNMFTTTTVNRELGVNLAIPTPIVTGNTYEVVVTVTNLGDIVEMNVQVDLTLDGVSVASGSRTSLAMNDNFQIIFSWTPTTNGTFVFEAVATMNAWADAFRSTQRVNVVDQDTSTTTTTTTTPTTISSTTTSTPTTTDDTTQSNSSSGATVDPLPVPGFEFVVSMLMLFSLTMVVQVKRRKQ